MNDQVELDEQSCLVLVDTVSIGRVVYEDGEQRIRPVNFVRAESVIYFRSDAPFPHDAAVTFEADHVDVATRRGWSVIARGRASATPSGESGIAVVDELEPWAGGPKSWVIAVTIESVTGRWVHAGDEYRPEPSGYL